MNPHWNHPQHPAAVTVELRLLTSAGRISILTNLVASAHLSASQKDSNDESRS